MRGSSAASINLPASDEVAPLRPGHNHIDFAAAAAGADEPIAPIEHGRFGASASSHFQADGRRNFAQSMVRALFH
jgi:hypothetical protein